MAAEAGLSCMATVWMGGLAYGWRSMATKVLQKGEG